MAASAWLSEHAHMEVKAAEHRTGQTPPQGSPLCVRSACPVQTEGWGGEPREHTRLCVWPPRPPGPGHSLMLAAASHTGVSAPSPDSKSPPRPEQPPSNKWGEARLLLSSPSPRVRHLPMNKTQRTTTESRIQPDLSLHVHARL